MDGSGLQRGEESRSGVARAFLVLCALLGTGCGGDVRPLRSALLITTDTTRADALGCYGGSAETPAIDRLAREGILFEAAHTVAPMTLPAHASMLTGLDPLRHGVRVNGTGALPDEAKTLAELAQGAGVQTAAFVASIILARPFGLAQGFDTYDVPRRSMEGGQAQKLHGAERRATEVVELALAWLARRDRERPFFLWVHFYDPHAPYDPPQAFRSGGDPYLEEVSAMDAQIGRLIDAMESEGALRETTVLVVADHGEAFGEHGEITHSSYCYETTLSVPLILRLPDLSRAGTRSRATVTVADVFPTLAESMGLAGAPLPETLDGISLLGTVPADRAVYFESFDGYFSHHWSPLAGVLDAGGKYIHSSDPELFDLGRDPGETRNLAREEPARSERYRSRLASWDALPKLRVHRATVDEELMQDIQSLGYSGMAAGDSGVPGPAEASSLPSPQSRSSWFRDLDRAQGLEAEGDLEQAASIFAAVLEQNPSDFLALEELGGLRFRQGRLGEAAELLRRLTREGPQRGRHYYSLGLCLRAMGDWDGAKAALARAVELAPHRSAYAKALHKLEARREAQRSGGN